MVTGQASLSESPRPTQQCGPSPCQTRFARSCKYNEVIIRSDHYRDLLPRSVAAVFIQTKATQPAPLRPTSHRMYKIDAGDVLPQAHARRLPWLSMHTESAPKEVAAASQAEDAMCPGHPHIKLKSKACPATSTTSGEVAPNQPPPSGEEGRPVPAEAADAMCPGHPNIHLRSKACPTAAGASGALRTEGGRNPYWWAAGPVSRSEAGSAV